jgi:hypothetical protein
VTVPLRVLAGVEQASTGQEATFDRCG